jgi:hypothetical protein
MTQDYSTGFPGGVLPDWLELRTDGVYASSTTTEYTGLGRGVTLATAASASKGAELQGTPIDLQNVAGVKITVWVHGGATSTKTVWFGFRPATADTGGALLRCAAADIPDAKFVGFDGAAAETRYLAEYEWVEDTGEGPTPPLYGLTLWLTSDKMVYLSEAGTDGIISIKEYDPYDMTYGNVVVPVVGILGTAGATAGVTMKVHKVEVTEYYWSGDPVYDLTSFDVADDFVRDTDSNIAGTTADSGFTDEVWADVSGTSTARGKTLNGLFKASAGAETGFSLLDLADEDVTVAGIVGALHPTPSARRIALVFRFQDYQNYHRLYLDPTANAYIYNKVVAGTSTAVYTSAVVPAVGDKVSVSVLGDKLNMTVNGVALTTEITMTNFLTAKKVGFLYRRYSSGTTTQDSISGWSQITCDL